MPASHRFLLRDAVQAAHIRTEAVVDEMHAFDDPRQYAKWLDAMLALHHATQTSCDRVSIAAGLAPLSKLTRTALQADLASLRAAPSPLADATTSMMSTATHIGRAYVLEGSGLGAQVLVRKAAARDLPCAYLTLWAEHAKPRWPVFVAYLDATQIDIQMASQAANDVFADLQAMLQRGMCHVAAR